MAPENPQPMRTKSLAPEKKGLILASAYRRSEDVRVHAVIVAELELRDIQREVLFADFVESADHATLNQRPETFDSVGVDSADNVFVLGVIDGFVRIFFPRCL